MKPKQFGFWKPGGTTGRVIAFSPYHAAQIILGTEEVYWVRGDQYSQPWVYTAKGEDVKLWEKPLE